MRQNRVLATFVILSSVSAAILAASCGDSGGQTGSNATGTGSSSGSGGAGGKHDGGETGGGGGLFGDSGNGCITAADCDGGVCVDGVCCDSAANACSGTCCSGGTVCLFDKCVMPGKPCHTANDCDPGQYCETALGMSPDGGPGDSGADGGLCTQPLPLDGRCLDLPPICDADAGAPGPDAGCVSQCEYHPPPGQLNAVTKWSWGPAASEFPNYIDVWSTPVVGRVYDGNCDGKVDLLDAPNVIFVSGNDLLGNPAGTNCQGVAINGTTMCHTGVLRMLDGNTGKEIWSLANDGMGSEGFSGTSAALGDVDVDGRVDIVVATGEGFIELIDSTGKVLRKSDKPVPGHGSATFGWGGGISIADMDGDGFPEIGFGATVYSTMGGKITLLWTGTGGSAGAADESLSTFVDLDGMPDNHLELLAGQTAYRSDGSVLWNRPGLPDGFPGVGDFDGDGKPEVALVGGGQLFILDGATGMTVLGPVNLPGTGSGGPPTVADFDGDGKPEIGVAMATFYSVMKPNFMTQTIDVLWQTPNHDLSSSVTGSTVFDFEGDGKAEVIYADECFLWVFDGQTGMVRFSAPHTSFTGTEASLVADIDGDGHAEIVMVTNGADPSINGWKCMDAQGQPVTVNGVTWTPSALPNKSYRGIVAFGDSSNSWVGTRTLWSEHTYHVSNICDDRDTACDAPNVYGSIPRVEKKNWALPWLNNFRQNVQDKGIFDAPDATVSLTVDCADPVVLHAAVRNIGLSSLPAGVNVGLYKKAQPMDALVGQVTTTHALFPGQTEELITQIDPAKAGKNDSFQAGILLDKVNPTFHECREDNDLSQIAKASCVQ
jgi:FG-GAP-like repeat